MNNDLLKEEILKVKKEKNAIILAHNYQTLDIHEIADIVGDSFQLAKIAEGIKSNIIVFCGVKFMAETAKLINPNTKVLLSAGDAGCPMADMASYEDLKKFKDEHPDYLIVCYVNSSIEVKSLCDVCVTSSNAVRIVNKLDKNKKIMFVPDKNLGHYVKIKTNRSIDLWDGMCPIHHLFFTIDDIKSKRITYPDHKIIVHPECTPEVVALADFVGSTKELADFMADNDKAVIGTELGLVEMLIQKYPQKSIIPLSNKAICQNMKKTSLNEVFETLKNEINEITISDEIAINAIKPIKMMLELN
ncbi:MAG: quinolinate synthase NadA [Candidatus Cloacimonetes bacterium]|jgi:quinolinate synthase|nr:quinolinate synthase NadA [Candidatus Cloacimonadota bacterium]MDD4156653.1 quinolinate synthase NadA [Candidatus Cloacimonadota bacterium]